MDDKQMTLTEHLTELRNRLFVILGAVAVVFLVGFFIPGLCCIGSFVTLRCITLLSPG